MPGVAVAGGERPPETVDTQGRIKRDIRSECFGVPRILSRSGPTPTRLVNGLCLASASHCARPRIGSLDRVTCTSTRGGSYHPPGIVPSQPPGFGISVPVQGPLRPSDPRLGGNRSRSGPCAAGPPSGDPSWDASVGWPRPISPSGEGRPNLPIGGWCLPTFIRTQAWRPRSFLRLRPVTGPGSSGPDTWSRFGGSYRHLPSVRPRQRVWLRPLPAPSTGRQVAVLRSGLGRSHDHDPNVRSPWNDPVSAGDLLGPQRPSPGCTMPPYGAPLCDLGRIGLPYTGMEKSTVSEGPRPSRLGGFTPTRPRIAPG